jgi:hypothetical protein
MTDENYLTEPATFTLGDKWNKKQPITFMLHDESPWLIRFSREKGIEANPEVPIDELSQKLFKIVNQLLIDNGK